ncbi:MULTISPECIES: RloB family protein [Actinoalloteichus]|uniref:RloB-like protein n=1 Tax=Actinoalloteichus caeruleus DSM 43889 TaxID=1120930 RepID=A0ABT1JLT9_ACTCY|nr:RloB family protein [Actinoalloteichus caeruleus]MCP2333134.1 RloB-like protein [Actinoalloteichus caeruleus DSM 43889]
MTRRGTGRDSLSRSRGNRNERRRILVVTEGKVTEPTYLTELRRRLRATGVSVSVVPGKHSDPSRVVDTARTQRDNAKRAGEAFDSVWCVVDVDDHRGLADAIRDASRARLKVAVSNPCFEIWLLWHCEDQTGAISSKALRKRVERYLDGKRLLPTFPYGAWGEACRRAAMDNPAVPPANPGSGVGELVIEMSGT